LFSPRPAFLIGTSPPSGHAFEVTESAGAGGPFFPPAGACATAIPHDAITAMAEIAHWVLFMLISPLRQSNLPASKLVRQAKLVRQEKDSGITAQSRLAPDLVVV
jgi:hypothetical protein